MTTDRRQTDDTSCYLQHSCSTSVIQDDRFEYFELW